MMHSTTTCLQALAGAPESLPWTKVQWTFTGSSPTVGVPLGRDGHDRCDGTHVQQPTHQQKGNANGQEAIPPSGIGAVLPVLATMTWVTGAAAVTTITTCGTLTKLGETYNLANDLTSTSCETCLTVANNRITINLKNYVISAECDGSGPDIAAGISDGGVARDLTTVRDGVIAGFDAGIDLTSSTRSTVLNLQVGFNLLAGIAVGDTSLVKSSLALLNFTDGIVVGERGQVQDNIASLNGLDGFGDGIYAGNRCLITRNSAEGNAEEGIATGGSCTVSFNAANGNGDDGIDVGADGDFDGSRSLVTGNTADDNGDVGIEAQCPSTVTFNSASGNDLNYNLFGTPPCDAHNNTSTGTNTSSRGALLAHGPPCRDGADRAPRRGSPTDRTPHRCFSRRSAREP